MTRNIKYLEPCFIVFCLTLMLCTTRVRTTPCHCRLENNVLTTLSCHTNTITDVDTSKRVEQRNGSRVRTENAMLVGSGTVPKTC